MILNNICDLFNSYIMETKDKLLIIYLETIRRLLMLRKYLDLAQNAKPKHKKKLREDPAQVQE